jgi:Protein of unknown function (DUF3619)
VNTLRNSHPVAGADAQEARFALQVAARLTSQAETITPDIGERLRVARELALERGRTLRAAQAAESRSTLTSAGAAILGGGWWSRLGLALPLAVLFLGLAFIQKTQFDEQVSAAADIDAALLADVVPPKAYGDPGFVEFLKAPRD